MIADFQKKMLSGYKYESSGSRIRFYRLFKVSGRMHHVAKEETKSVKY